MGLREKWMGWMIREAPELAELPSKSGIKSAKADDKDEGDVEVALFDGTGQLLEVLSRNGGGGAGKRGGRAGRGG